MTTSSKLFDRASGLMPGGVNSPVRAFRSVGGTPPFIVAGSGARLTDVDGNEYIDFVGSWGPLILGHAHPAVVEAVKKAAEKGLSFGACHEGEIALAGLIRSSMPHVEMLRLVSSGTEAAMSAVRLARAVTEKDVVIKFAGCYHGHADAFLVKAGSGALTFGAPSSPGVTAGTARDTVIAEYNDLGSVGAAMRDNAGSVACVIVEPVAGNMGVVPPAEGFLQGLRSLCDASGALLIFDEVITGFRIAAGGAVERYGVTPDLTVLGKIIGGGMPVGAFGGRRALMERMSPAGPVYQAGTLSGNPLGCAAGGATLATLARECPYPRIEALSARLDEGTRANMREACAPWTANRVASMSTLFFGISSATSLGEVSMADTGAYAGYHAAMLRRGIYLAPSQFEAMFVSAAHSNQDIDQALEAQRSALKEVFGQ